jgi:hypothetical protein
VRVSTPNERGSSTRSRWAAANPSTSRVSPPSAALAWQCSNWMVGTGSRYGLSVCGLRASPVEARLAGVASTRTSNTRP